jgi:hypothetical protein
LALDVRFVVVGAVTVWVSVLDVLPVNVRAPL